MPMPQLALHADQPDHSDQTPLTGAVLPGLGWAQLGIDQQMATIRTR